EPVAITSPSYGTGVPPSSVTVRAAGSSARAGRPSSSRTAIDSYHDGSRSRIDSLSGPYRSASLESGGRSYGRWGSAPTRVRSPSNPLARRVSMAWTAASDPPTTTTLCMTSHLCRLWLAHHQAGHGDEKRDAEQVSHIEDHSSFERGHHVEVLVERADDEHVDPDWWADRPDRGHQGDDDREPHRVVAEAHRHREEDRDADDQEPQRVHERAADQVDDDDQEKHHNGRCRQGGRPVGELEREPGQAQEPAEHHRPGDEQEDHRGDPQALHRGL